MLPLKDAARTLDKTILELVHEIDRATIPYISEGGRCYLNEDDLLAYMERQEESLHQNERKTVLSVRKDLPIEKRITPDDIPLLEKPAWQEEAKFYLGEKLPTYVKRYGEDKVIKVTRLLEGSLGKDTAKKVLEADTQDSIWQLSNGSEQQYFASLYNAWAMVQRKFSGAIPSNFLPGESPSRFLPSSIGAMEQELSRKKTGPVTLPAEIMGRLSVDSGLAQGLMKEGHDIIYLWAMLVKGFKLGTGFQRIGEQYQDRIHWESNLEHALSSLGINYERRRFDAQYERVKELIIFKKQGDAVTFNSNWADLTTGHLRDYLRRTMNPRRG